MRPQRHLKPDVKRPIPGRTHSGPGWARRAREARGATRATALTGTFDGSPYSESKSFWVGAEVPGSSTTSGAVAAAAVTRTEVPLEWGRTARPPNASAALASRTTGGRTARLRDVSAAACRGRRDGGTCGCSGRSRRRGRQRTRDPEGDTRRVPALRQRAVTCTLYIPLRSDQPGSTR